MQVAFYIAKYGNWFDKIIGACTLPIWCRKGQEPVSHCELVIFPETGMSFSASNREGCRFTKTIDYASGHWIFRELPPGLNLTTAINACLQIEGQKYDWVGVFLGWIGIHRPDAYFCSESLVRVLTKCGMKPKARPWFLRWLPIWISRPKGFSPQMLLEAMSK